MKILFIGDYSGLHATIGAELRNRGHLVTVISDSGRFMLTEADRVIERGDGISGSIRYLLKLLALLPAMKGYDVVQLINPHFLSLRPARLRKIFNFLKRNNGSVFLTLAGNDYKFVEACMKTDMYRFSEFMIGNEPTPFERTSHYGASWLTEELRIHSDYIYGQINGAISVLPEYDMASREDLGNRLLFCNIPIDLSSLPYHAPEYNDKVRLLIGIKPGREMQKGTDILSRIAHRLEERFPALCTVEEVRGLPLTQYLSKLADSHIVLDQLYSYSPATNALQAMALGCVAASGAQPEYYHYIGTNMHPIIELSPIHSSDRLEADLENLIKNPERLKQLSLEGRKLVEMHNDVQSIVPLIESHWNSLM